MPPARQVGHRGEEVADGSGAGVKGQPGPAMPGLHAEGGASQDGRLSGPGLPSDHQCLPRRLIGGEPLTNAS